MGRHRGAVIAGTQWEDREGQGWQEGNGKTEKGRDGRKAMGRQRGAVMAGMQWEDREGQ